jgi:phosphoribosyl 1,2-cyclic phosphodiesterase
VLISHEHGDHICGLLSLLKRAKRARLYMTRLAAPCIDWGRYEPRYPQFFQAGQTFRIGDVGVQTFTVPHDAIDPVGFCLCVEGMKIGLVTDLGYIPDSVRVHVRETEFLMIESNHDLDMLKVGPYPWSVKQRVMGRNGHLSNAMVSDFIADGLGSCVRTLVLTHLSEHNNHPVIAHMMASRAIGRRSSRPNLVVSQPREQSQIWEF